MLPELQLSIEAGLAEGCGVRCGMERGKPCFGYLVNVAARLAATELKRFPVLTGEEAHREPLAAVHEPERVSLGPDEDEGHLPVPELSEGAPAGGHGVERIGATGGEQHPVVGDESEDIVINFGG